MPVVPQDGDRDQRALERAVELAASFASFSSPNPAVGCVLLRGDTLLGEGAHRYDRKDHAEIVALKAALAAGGDVRGATAFVTLEPCSHHGRTGPCADALIAAGVARCVVATLDPNPLVRGQGLARMRAAGVQVEVLAPADPLAQRARRLNDAFAFAVQHGRPFVTLKTAVSCDGKLAPPPSHRNGAAPVWLTGPSAREDVQRLRHESDALLTGIGTVLADDPLLSDRTGLPRRRPLLRVVLDSQLRLSPDAALTRSAAGDLLVLCTTGAAPELAEALRARGVEVLALPAAHDGRLPLAEVLAALAARSMRSVLLEAGSALNGAFLGADLVDRVVLYRAPVELGPEGVPFATSRGLPALEARLSRQALVAFPHDHQEDLRVSGYIHDPWARLDDE